MRSCTQITRRIVVFDTIYTHITNGNDYCDYAVRKRFCILSLLLLLLFSFRFALNSITTERKNSERSERKYIHAKHHFFRKVCG